MRMLIRIINWAVLIFGINSPFILESAPTAAKIVISAVWCLYFLVYAVFPTVRKYPTLRLRILGDGTELILAFWVTCAASAVFAAFEIGELIRGDTDYTKYIIYAVVLVIIEALLFWDGIIRIYVTSVQLGIKYRVLGIVFGMIPIANLIMLMLIYRKAHRELETEIEKFKLNESRKEQKVCATKYPILLVHGVFFRDSRLVNYWGRIPAELEKNGATVYYGNQQSALSVEASAEELAAAIEEIVTRTGCGKLNIIAHSKGGLDSRYAISALGSAKYTASLTTVSTPHRGCIFAEYLLKSCDPKLKKFIENTYNKAYYALGDETPDFMAAVECLTNSYCEEFNKTVPDSPDVVYRSYGSKATNRKSGRFPLNVSYPVVKKYDGDNDGLVALSSAPWGEKFTPVYPTGKRGITHADMIDLNREDIKGFDVREFYVQMVSELKERGL